jgi:phosphate transport system protein
MEAEALMALMSKLTQYARFVEDMIGRSVTAALENRPDLLDSILGADEDRANAFEVELEQDCAALLAQFEPRARELRTVLMALGITTDLERMADHAVNIAETVKTSQVRAALRPSPAMSRMAEATVRMVEQSLQAFITEDAPLARTVCENDDTVDDLADRILTEVSSSMGRDPTSIEAGLAELKIAGNLERIADLSTNICEDVIYVAEGKIIKHLGAEEGAEAEGQ